VPVTLGTSREVTALPGESTQLLISKGKKGSVTQEVTLMDGVEAPVQRGQSLGRLTIRAGEEILAEIPLVASEAVDRLTWGRLTLRILRQAAMALPEEATENSTR
jgi:D-alanyl-D-alanine carboxypeptidase (penicillin-binding protein 5/6)